MRDSDKPMSQREAYQRGYAAGRAAAQSGPPREPTQEMDDAASNVDRSNLPGRFRREVWRAMWDKWQEQTGGSTEGRATAVAKPDQAASAGRVSASSDDDLPSVVSTAGIKPGLLDQCPKVVRGELCCCYRIGADDDCPYQPAATPSSAGSRADHHGAAQAATDGPAADPLPVAWATPSLLVTMSAVEKRLLTSPEMRGRGAGWEADARDADRYSVPLYSAAALDRLRAERDIGRALVKDLCEEWNEKCDCYERGVSKFEGHDDKCKSANLGEAKRALRERAERAEAERDALREVVRAAVEIASRICAASDGIGVINAVAELRPMLPKMRGVLYDLDAARAKVPK